MITQTKYLSQNYASDIDNVIYDPVSRNISIKIDDYKNTNKTKLNNNDSDSINLSLIPRKLSPLHRFSSNQELEEGKSYNQSQLFECKSLEYIENSRDLKIKLIFKMIWQMDIHINSQKFMELLRNEDLQKSHYELICNVVNKYLEDDLLEKFSPVSIEGVKNQVLETLKRNNSTLQIFTATKNFPPKNHNMNSNHSSFLNTIIEPISKNNDDITIINMEHQLKNCPICYEDKDLNVFYQKLPCEHIFCQTCLVSYLNENLKSNTILRIPCPFVKCPYLLLDNDIKNLLDVQSYHNYFRLKDIQIVNNDLTLRWCVRPGCEKYIKGNEQQPHLICECGQEHCFNCREPWHPSQTCEEIINKDFQALCNVREVKKCPKCATRIEKDGGCNHITCKICSHQWCWRCNLDYSSDHLNINNPLRCPMLEWKLSVQAARRLRPKKIIVSGLLCPLFFLIDIVIGCLYCLAIIPVMIFLLFYITGKISVSFWRVNKNQGSLKYKCWIELVWFILGVLLLPVTLFIFMFCSILNMNLPNQILWIKKWTNQLDVDLRKFN